MSSTIPSQTQTTALAIAAIALAIAFAMRAGATEAEPHAGCLAPNADEATVGKADWQQVETLADAEAQYKALYTSGRRIEGRAYWSESEQSHVLPFRKSTDSARLPLEIISAIAKHLETALERGYANFVFYPDLGHAHLVIPTADSAQIPATLSHREIVEKIFANRDLKFLYHTAELFKLKEGSIFDGPVVADPWLAWRYYSRNFSSSLGQPQDLAVLFQPPPGYNTVRSLPGYSERQTIYFSASSSGCFQTMGKDGPIRFDLSVF